MNSSKNKKTRKKVSIRCRKISSTSNRSYLSSSHVASAGNYKRRITSLLKNNKTLAVALQDARCELSTNKSLLEESTLYLNKIKCARFKMLEMYSVLKSFVQDFDETLLLLKFDDSKLIDIGAPTRLEKKFKNKMKKVVESINEVSEGVSIDQGLDFGQEIVENTECSSDQMISNVGNTSNVFCKEIVEVDELTYSENQKVVTQSVQDFMENISSAQTVDIDLVPESHFSTASLCEPSKGRQKRYKKAEKETSPKNVPSLKNDESSTTPKLNIPVQTTTNLETSPELKSDFSHKNCSSPAESLSKILINPSTALASKKFQTSKIPRIQDLPVKIKTPKNVNMKKAAYKRKFVKNGTEESDSKFCRRKTFVIKDDSEFDNISPSVTLNKNLSNLEEVLHESTLDIDGESDRLCRRKTYVVKIPDILEYKRNSESDRGKKIVKKSSNKSASVISRRDTFTVSELAFTLPKNNESTDHSENLNIVSDVSVIKDTAEKNVNFQTDGLEINIHAPIIEKSITVQNSEELQHISNNAIIPTDMNIPPKIYSVEIQETNEICVNRESNVNNMVSKSSEELKTKVCCDDKVKQNEVKAVGDIKVMDTDVTSNRDLQKDMENDIEIIDLCGNVNSRSSKHVSYKLFLESSESECESIPDLNFNEKMSSIRTTPIRRRISSTKRRKVFIFDGNKRKSTVSKKSINKCTSSETSPNFLKRSTESGLSNVINNKNIENQSRVKDRKTVSFVISDQTNENSPVDTMCSDSCNIKQKFSKILANKVKGKEINKKIYKFSDSDTGDGNEFNRIDLNDVIGVSEVCHENPLLVTTNEKCAEEKQSEKELNKKHQATNNIPCKSTKKQTNKCHMVRKAKQNPTKDNVVIDDIISVAKKNKRHNLKKKSEEIIHFDEEAIIPNMQNDINNLTEDKSIKVKAKKFVNKSLVKKELPCKKTGENTFLVHAEVHPPPSSLNIPEIEDMNKENDKDLRFQNFQVSVVLNDIMKSQNIGTLNISCEKDLLLQGRTFPLKAPFSDNSCNIPPVLVESAQCVNKNVACLASNSEEVTTKRLRHKGIKSYQEPKLNLKLRR